MGKNTWQSHTVTKKALRAIAGASYNSHTAPILKKLKLLSLPDIHNTKLLCLYKQHNDHKLPKYINYMFTGLNNLEPLVRPRTRKFENTIRYELPHYLRTTPEYLITLSKKVSHTCFKMNVKKYLLDRYSTLCTVTGCRVCQMSHIQTPTM